MCYTISTKVKLMTKFMKSSMIFFRLILLFSILSANSLYGQKVIIRSSLNFTDIDKKNYQVKQNKLNVFIFLDTECPISQRYTSTLVKIKNELDYLYPKSIAFYTVFPTKGATSTEIRAFNDKFHLNYPSLLDSHHLFTNMFNATITPEVFVVNQSGKLEYQGAIDNWYYQLGKARAKADSLYLKNAILSVFTKKKVDPNLTKAVGCDIER